MTIIYGLLDDEEDTTKRTLFVANVPWNWEYSDLQEVHLLRGPQLRNHRSTIHSLTIGECIIHQTSSFLSLACVYMVILRCFRVLGPSSLLSSTKLHLPSHQNFPLEFSRRRQLPSQVVKPRDRPAFVRNGCVNCILRNSVQHFHILVCDFCVFAGRTALVMYTTEEEMQPALNHKKIPATYAPLSLKLPSALRKKITCQAIPLH